MFVWLKMALWPNWLTFFRSFHNNLGLWPKILPKTGWNTVKGNVFDFSNSSISSALHGCCSVGSNCLILHPIKTMFFNQLIQFCEDGWSSWVNSNVKTAQLENVFCFLIGKPTTQNQLNLFWNICCFIKLNTKQLSFLQHVKKLFQQIFCNMTTSTVCLVVLLNSGIFLS